MERLEDGVAVALGEAVELEEVAGDAVGERVVCGLGEELIVEMGFGEGDGTELASAIAWTVPFESTTNRYPLSKTGLAVTPAFNGKVKISDPVVVLKASTAPEVVA